ncbi:MAG: ribosomal protein S18-alanine N-acetyltransferase [Lachnospiraceae bacterium]|nr:ribosomal protein S18-alanine N-acetyltransferase [Lachnospiraceae bacterium]
MFDILRMNGSHIEEVSKLEEDIFAIPWTKKDFEREIYENSMAIYFVAVFEGRVIGYAGMWHVVTEGHITNVAVDFEFRGRGIGEALTKALIDEAYKREMVGITLEVRITNEKAQRLYTKLGFKPEGIRKRYYSDTGEDAVIMWKYFEFYENYEP